jgi:hypothetical protein
MRVRLALAVLMIGAAFGPRLAPAQTPAASATAPSADEIRQELEAIKKLRTLPILPAAGTDDAGGATILRIDNTSAFPIAVLIVGPATERIELPSGGVRTLRVPPGEYEIAVKAVGRDLPPLYGTQTITPKLRFRHQFAIPAR